MGDDDIVEPDLLEEEGASEPEEADVGEADDEI